MSITAQQWNRRNRGTHTDANEKSEKELQYWTADSLKLIVVDDLVRRIVTSPFMAHPGMDSTLTEQSQAKFSPPALGIKF